MSRRIEIEITSSHDDGTFTWRAAGARQPKGSVSASVLPAAATVGNIYRVEVETDLDGTEVLQVIPDRVDRHEPDRLEIIARPVADDALVTSKLSGKGGGRGGRQGRDDRGEGRRGERSRPGDDRGKGRTRTGERPARTGERPARTDGPSHSTERKRSAPRGERSTAPPAVPAKPKAPRLRPARTHRNEVVAGLSIEQQPIAEQVIRGGVPAVRQGIERQNELARSKGDPEINPQGIVDIAERILPALRVAEWRDRAEAALADVDRVDLRDLRSVVVASEDSARDDDTRNLADELRKKLAERVELEQHQWLGELNEALTDKRIVRALKLSSRPPKAGSPLPAELVERITEAANAALSLDAGQTRWIAIIDALAFSPVRHRVMPAAIPEKPSDDLAALIGRVATRLPELATKFGIEPTKGPATKSGPTRAGNRRRRPAGSSARPAKPVTQSRPAPAAPKADEGHDKAKSDAATPDTKPDVVTPDTKPDVTPETVKHDAVIPLPEPDVAAEPAPPSNTTEATEPTVATESAPDEAGK